MKLRTLLFGFVLGGATVLMSGQVFSDGEDGLSEGEMLEAVKKSAVIGPYHRNLKSIKQSYEQAIKWWPSPDAKPHESTGRSETKWILGKRFLTQKVDGKWLGPSFKGFGILGYDNASKQYEMAWMDSLSTHILICKGTCDDSGKIITMHGDYLDPITGQPKKIRTVLQILNRKGESLLEMFDETSPSREFKFLEIKSKRFVATAA